MQTKIYEAGRPREHWDDPYGTIEPIGLLVLLECDLAVTRQMGFGADPPELVCYPVWGDETDAARYDQIKYNAALTVLFSAASTPAGDPVNFNVTLHVYPEDLPGVTWAKTDGPDSGTLLNSEQPVATYANPAKGGLYTFTTTVGVGGDRDNTTSVAGSMAIATTLSTAGTYRFRFRHSFVGTVGTPTNQRANDIAVSTTVTVTCV